MRLKPVVKLLLTVLLAGAVTAWLVASHSKGREKRLAGVLESRARLVEMLGPSRPFEGRLFGMGYAKVDLSLVTGTLPLRRLKNALTLVDSNRTYSEAEHLSNRALVYGFGGELDLAIQALERAKSSEGSKAWMWSDLSVFYAERFRRKGDSHDLLKALDSSAYAKDSASMSQEAHFNYALILEKFSLVALARTAWTDYTVRDSDSAWSAEAKSHLRHVEGSEGFFQWEGARKHLEEATSSEQVSIARALVRDFPQFAREYGEETLLGHWATSWQKGNLWKAQRSLSLARHLARWIGTDAGDHMLGDTVSAIDRAIAAGGNRPATLAHLHAQYYKAVNDMSGGCRQSAVLFREAEKGFREFGSPFFRWAWLRVAVCQSRGFKYGSAKYILNQIRSLPAASRFPALAGHVHWTLGLIHGIEGDPAGALLFYKRSLSFFELVREDENIANLQVLTAECLKMLGNLAQAWNHSWNSLRKASYVRNARKKYGLLSEAANLAADLGLPEAATLLMKEAIAISSNADPVGRVAAFRWQAVLCTRIGRLGDAADAVSKARRLLSGVVDIDARFALRGDLLAIESAVLAKKDPDLALGKLSEAIDSYQRTVYFHQLVDLMLRRGTIEASVRRFGQAERDLSRAIAIFRAVRKNVPADSRESFLDKGRQIYDEMARVQLALGRTSEALEYIERSRSQLLLDRLSVADIAPSRSSHSGLLTWLQQELPRDTVLVQYRFLGGSCYVWVVRRRGLERFDCGDEKSIDASVEALHESWGKPGSAAQFRDASAAVFDRIFRPIMRSVGGAERIVFIPDGSLWRLPFSALLDRRSGRFLVESFAVVVAPSATVHVLAAQHRRQLAENATSILVVGNPVIARDVWQILPNLSDSSVEAQGITSMYSRVRSLVGINATVKKFLEESPKYSIIHMAVHSFPISASSPFAFFVLSPEHKGDAGALYARQIRGLRLHRTQLVILSTCDSLGGSIGITEGLSGLAEPFLSAGVPSVIGSLARISDGYSRIVSERLHFWIRKGVEPALALRLVQIERIKVDAASEGVLPWATLEAFGA